MAQASEAMPATDNFTGFDDTPVNPTEAAALAGAGQFRDGTCDGIVGIGGGAALDLAKAIAILAANPPPLWDYCNRRSEEHTSELQSLMRISYAVFCLKKKKQIHHHNQHNK